MWGCTCRLPVPGVPERAVLLLAWREFCRCSQPQPALVICRCSCPPSSALCVPGADPALQGAELTRAWRWVVTLGHGEGFWHPHQPRCPGEAVGGSAPEASPPGEQRGPIRAADQPPPTPTPPPAIPDSGGGQCSHLLLWTLGSAPSAGRPCLALELVLEPLAGGPWVPDSGWGWAAQPRPSRRPPAGVGAQGGARAAQAAGAGPRAAASGAHRLRSPQGSEACGGVPGGRRSPGEREMCSGRSARSSVAPDGGGTGRLAPRLLGGPCVRLLAPRQDTRDTRLSW